MTKKGGFKRLDVSNRVKALHDAFSKALLIDDCNFVEISARKYAVSLKEQEWSEIIIELCDFVEVGSSDIVTISN